MNLGIAFGLCLIGIISACLASYIGAILRFAGRFDGKADDHEKQRSYEKEEIIR